MFLAVASYFILMCLRHWIVTLDKSRDAIFVKPAIGFLGSEKLLCKLSEGTALQICSELAFTRKQTTMARIAARFSMHELNLVLGGPEYNRINICRHHKHKTIMEYAQTVASFLDVPLVDHSHIR